MAIDVVVGDVAVQSPSYEVGECAQRPDVGRLVQQQSVFARESLAGVNLLDDGLKTSIEAGEAHATDPCPGRLVREAGRACCIFSGSKRPCIDGCRHWWEG